MNALLLALFLVPSQARAFALTGQSLSVGYNSTPALSTAQTQGNTSWTGNNGSADAPTQGAVPSTTASLVEASVESPRAAIANCYESITGEPLLAMSNGVNNTAYSGLKRGTAPWTRLVNMLESYGARIGGSFLGLAVIHGESDRLSSTYCTDLAEWQSDMEALSARVGTGTSVPLYVSQMSSCTFYTTTSLDTCVAPMQQYTCAKNNPDILLVGPKYHLTHPDGVHLTNATSRRHGEEIGKAMAHGPTWTGLRPSAVSANGAAISITFHVPVPPLVLDTSAVSDPGNYGFTYTDAGTPPAISSVELAGDDTVVVTLASTPTGENRRIRYAYTGTSGASAGPTTGMRGNLRDSDTTTCGSGTMLRNWSVHFEEAVP